MRSPGDRIRTTGRLGRGSFRVTEALGGLVLRGGRGHAPGEPRPTQDLFASVLDCQCASPGGKKTKGAQGFIVTVKPFPNHVPLFFRQRLRRAAFSEEEGSADGALQTLGGKKEGGFHSLSLSVTRSAARVATPWPDGCLPGLQRPSSPSRCQPGPFLLLGLGRGRRGSQRGRCEHSGHVARCVPFNTEFKEADFLKL